MGALRALGPVLLLCSAGWAKTILLAEPDTALREQNQQLTLSDAGQAGIVFPRGTNSNAGATAAPESSPMALVIGGIVLIWIGRRRRRNSGTIEPNG